jgi:hypothetical protein
MSDLVMQLLAEAERLQLEADDLRDVAADAESQALDAWRAYDQACDDLAESPEEHEDA